MHQIKYFLFFVFKYLKKLTNYLKQKWWYIVEFITYKYMSTMAQKQGEEKWKHTVIRLLYYMGSGKILDKGKLII